MIVDRRIGGLENVKLNWLGLFAVDRRIGGLEK